MKIDRRAKERNSTGMKSAYVRRIQQTDANGLLQYFNQLVALDSERVERPEDAKKLNLELELNWIRKRLGREVEKEMYTLCAECDGNIVAVGEIERGKRWIERHVAELRFGVLPDFHDAASKVARELLSWGKNAGIEVVIYFHLETQSKGIRTMKELGFKECGRISKYYKRNDQYIDRIYFSKNLAE